MAKSYDLRCLLKKCLNNLKMITNPKHFSFNIIMAVRAVYALQHLKYRLYSMREKRGEVNILMNV